MAGSADRVARAAQTHRRAVAIAAAAGPVLAGRPPRPPSASTERGIRELAERLRAAAARLAPGWLGGPLDAVPASAPAGAATVPDVVRIGTGYPLDDASFPVVVPLGHVAFDADARDPRVAGVLRAVLLRLLASAPAGGLLVRAVDPTGTVFAPFAPLHRAGIMPPPAADHAGLRAVLGEAGGWVRGPRAHPDRTLLLVVAAWPQDTGSGELDRVSALAEAGAGRGVRLLVAGWPPPPLADGSAGRPLPGATQVSLRNPYALVGHPPGSSFGTPVPAGESQPAGLNAQVFLDRSPSPDLITRVCAGLTGSAPRPAPVRLGELLPGDPLWSHDATDGLATMVGRSADAPTVLRLADATAHWLVVGRAGAGKTSLLRATVYGLAGRYRPDQLAIYLLDLAGTGSFAEFVPTATDPWSLPHARAVTAGPDRAEPVAVLRALVAQLTRREAEKRVLPRLVCLVDEVGLLLAGTGPEAARAAEAAGAGPEAAGLLRALAERGGPVGVHLVLAGRHPPPAPIASRCRVRIALAGGAAALDPANHAAAALATGTAVVNTAGGLGGPRGATRAHERVVSLPDPRADPPALAGLRERLGLAGGGRR
jgi:hypothetical protein